MPCTSFPKITAYCFSGSSLLSPSRKQSVDTEFSGGGADAAEDYAPDAESIAGTEGRADVVTAADIVQNHCYGAFGEGLVFLDGGASEFAVQ